MLEIIPQRTRETIQFLVALTESVRYIVGMEKLTKTPRTKYFGISAYQGKLSIIVSYSYSTRSRLTQGQLMTRGILSYDTLDSMVLALMGEAIKANLRPSAMFMREVKDSLKNLLAV